MFEPVVNASSSRWISCQPETCRKVTQITFLVIAIVAVVGGALSLVAQAHPGSALNALGQLGPTGAKALLGGGIAVLLGNAFWTYFSKKEASKSETKLEEIPDVSLFNVVRSVKNPVNGASMIPGQVNVAILEIIQTYDDKNVSTQLDIIDRFFYENYEDTEKLKSLIRFVAAVIGEIGSKVSLLYEHMAFWLTQKVPSEFQEEDKFLSYEAATAWAEALEAVYSEDRLLMQFANFRVYEAGQLIGKNFLDSFTEGSPGKGTFCEPGASKFAEKLGLFTFTYLPRIFYKEFLRGVISAFQKNSEYYDGAGTCLSWLLDVGGLNKEDAFIQALNELELSSIFGRGHIIPEMRAYSKKTKEIGVEYHYDLEPLIKKLQFKD